MSAGAAKSNIGNLESDMQKFVYLAGPVLGMTEGQANDWRQYVAGYLKGNGITGISPLRCEPIHGPIYEAGYPDERFGTARAIMNKNFYDVQNCDMTLAYIPKPAEGKHHSFGTLEELAWAYALGKRIILVTDDPEIANHPVINGQVGWIFDNFDDAIDVLVGILGGYTGGKNV
jgi:nucleoside 2-deoxyribosyltransferase